MTFQYKQFYKKGLNIPKDDKCAICKQTKERHQLVVHHRDNNPKDNARNNLIVLCSSCHKKVHFSKLKIPKEEQTILI